MIKRGKLEIIRDILKIIKDNKNSIRVTPLLRTTNISSTGFKEYYTELLNKKLIKEIRGKKEKRVSVTETGFKFLEKYKTIVNFIEEFGL
jgi:predicted transcriptional regulator